MESGPLVGLNCGGTSIGITELQNIGTMMIKEPGPGWQINWQINWHQYEHSLSVCLDSSSPVT